MLTEHVRRIVALHARLPAAAGVLGDDTDLFDAGLTSLATVNLMLALEAEFDVEFPDALMCRATFSSVHALAAAVASVGAAA